MNIEKLEQIRLETLGQIRCHDCGVVVDDDEMAHHANSCRYARTNKFPRFVDCECIGCKQMRRELREESARRRAAEKDNRFPCDCSHGPDEHATWCKAVSS